MPQYIPERRSGWVFDKTINIPTIWGFVLAFCAIVGWGGGVNTDIKLLYSENKALKEALASLTASQNAMTVEIRQEFRENRARMDAVKDALVKKN